MVQDIQQQRAEHAEDYCLTFAELASILRAGLVAVETLICLGVRKR